MSTIKSGTLLKQVQGFLTKDWKPKHCVLYSDGEFSIYQSITDATAEIRINLRTDVRSIETGYDCGSVSLPKNRSRDVDSLFGIFGNEKKPHYFLSTREEECREWVIALDRIMNQPLPSKSSMAPPPEPPPYSSIMEYQQHVNADPPASNVSSSQNQPTNTSYSQPSYQPPPPQMGQPQPMMYPPQQPVMYGQQPMYGYAPQPMYGPPMYGQPMYQQPVYVQQAPQQQQSRGGSNTGSLLLAGGGGLLGGYLLGSAMSEMSHHHGHHDHGYHDHGGYGGGDFDGGGGFDF